MHSVSIFDAVYYLKSRDPYQLHKDFFAGLDCKEFLVIYHCEEPERTFLIITPSEEIVNHALNAQGYVEKLQSLTLKKSARNIVPVLSVTSAAGISKHPKGPPS